MTHIALPPPLAPARPATHPASHYAPHPHGAAQAGGPAVRPALQAASFQVLAAAVVMLQDRAAWPVAWAAGAAALGALSPATQGWPTPALRLLAGVMLGSASLLGSDWGVTAALAALALAPGAALQSVAGAALAAMPAALATALVPTPERAGLTLLAFLAALLGPIQAQAAPADPATAEPHQNRPSIPDIQRILGRDQVTGLPNRLGLAHLLADETGRAATANTALSVLLIRLDEVPTQPRLATRPVMAAVADTLQSALQRPFDRLAWMGAGRFAAILPFTDALGADQVARRMAETMAPASAAEHTAARCPRSTLSIGIATYAGRGTIGDTILLQQAEEAESAALAAGGARIVRYDPMAATLRPKSFAERDPEGARLVAAKAGT